MAGCIVQPKNTLAPGNEGAPGVQRFLLCSPNLATALPGELRAGVKPLDQEIELYLRARRREVEKLNFYDGRLLWRRAVSQAEQRGEDADAGAIFTRRLAEHFEFDAIVIPSILVHTTRVADSVGTWNGVRRRMGLVKPARAVGGRGQDTFADGVALGGMTGPVQVASVHLFVYSREGERIFEGFGGLDYLYDIDMSGARASYQGGFSPNEELFESDLLHEGIEIAFTPYLAPIER